MIVDAGAFSICLADEGAIPDLLALNGGACDDERCREIIQRSVTSGSCFVAVADGVAAAFIVLEYSFFGNGFIPVLVVHPDYRRRGFGEALIRHVEGECRTARLFTLTSSSDIPMKALLAKMGFELSGVIHNLDDWDPGCLIFSKSRGVVEAGRMCANEFG